MIGRTLNIRDLPLIGKGIAGAVSLVRMAGAAAICLTCSGYLALAAEPGNSEMGGRLAAEVCAECHAVNSGDLDSPHLDAPPFQVIADRPATTALALGVWFRSPHPTMPNFVLTPDETSNLIAYIFSLREE